MAVHNASGDAANTAVRAFLTKVGEHYLERSYNTGSKQGKVLWMRIKEDFKNKCAYCNKKTESLQIEHLVKFNRTECGLHHPGNTVPVCKSCNKTRKNAQKKDLNWQDHLRAVCRETKTETSYDGRYKKIISHIKKEKYPNLTKDEKNTIKVVCKRLYENIKNEVESSLALYKDLDLAFVKN